MPTPTPMTRRGFLSTSGTAVAGMTLATWMHTAVGHADSDPNAHLPSPNEALQMLLDGNKRYVANKMQGPNRTPNRRQEIAPAQAPFATIVSCIDSRVPPEIVFDRGMGDLFVVRTAGEVMDNAVLGSIEFAAGLSRMPLLMVLGHTRCGAVKTTIRVLDEHSPVPPGTHLDALVNAIRPALEQSRHMPGDLVDNAVWVQVGMTVRSITNLPLLADPIQHKRLLVVGAVYNLETGNVELAMS